MADGTAEDDSARKLFKGRESRGGVRSQLKAAVLDVFDLVLGAT